MRTIPDFALKRFFNDGAASTARANLSPSFAEPLSTAELLAFEPAAAAQLTRLPLSYTGMYGGLELRAAIANQYRHLGPEAIIATCGADDALSLLFMALVEAGDHVIVQSPIYQPLTSVAEWCGAEITLWPASEQEGWQPSLEHLRRLLQPTTRLIVVNFPHSPTGFVPDQDYLEQLSSLAEEAGITLICDEIYQGLPLTDAGEPPSLADLSQRAVVLNSISKVYGLPGLRVGWVATRNAEVLVNVKSLRMHFNSFIGAPSEFLAALALRHADRILDRNRALARANLAHLRDFLG
ncbi:MAG TPA: aminotransferase class I/II-fold pyridoxal phosphate-dependent enzyme, partial [Thermomicrobiales bacterium]|nr:aminotransferase class I/II-fold pyridoxal phosphate-dependent enzyme [Thermomicrobiales bacterium]